MSSYNWVEGDICQILVLQIVLLLWNYFPNNFLEEWMVFFNFENVKFVDNFIVYGCFYYCHILNVLYLWPLIHFKWFFLYIVWGKSDRIRDIQLFVLGFCGCFGVYSIFFQSIIIHLQVIFYYFMYSIRALQECISIFSWDIGQLLPYILLFILYNPYNILLLFCFK